MASKVPKAGVSVIIFWKGLSNHGWIFIAAMKQPLENGETILSNLVMQTEITG